MLPHFDPDLVGWLVAKFTELGIDVRTQATVARIEQTANGFLVHADGLGESKPWRPIWLCMRRVASLIWWNWIWRRATSRPAKAASN
jgi:hypothetical protein